MGTWLDYYYKAWTSEKPTKLLAQFESYRVKKPPFNNETYEQFGDDVLAYWYYYSTMCKELGFIATKIFSICVNSASVERLFSSMVNWLNLINRISFSRCNYLNVDLKRHLFFGLSLIF
ncbi:unnamed protein product [Rhizophagus irregularis]|nr:unnamed protein product [Rhizophagus irregularis]